MKSVGERIRQARVARDMSQDALAKRAGFKNQSAIGNLENRATGRGGFSLPRIAAILEVPIDWLLDGPDSAQVPRLSEGRSHRAKEGAPPAYTDADRAVGMIRTLPDKALKEALQFLEYLSVKYNSPSQDGADLHVPAPEPRKTA